ncbi:hypothetical protein IAU59_004964 [Kwoniella sp. CBS 9459]
MYNAISDHSPDSHPSSLSVLPSSTFTDKSGVSPLKSFGRFSSMSMSAQPFGRSASSLGITPEEEEELRQAIIAMSSAPDAPLLLHPPPIFLTGNSVHTNSPRAQPSVQAIPYQHPGPHLSWDGDKYPLPPEMLSHWDLPEDYTIANHADWGSTIPLFDTGEAKPVDSQFELDDLHERMRRRKEGDVTISNTPQPATPIKQARFPSSGSIRLSPLLTHRTTLRREATSTPTPAATLLTSPNPKGSRTSLLSRASFIYSDSEDDSSEEEDTDTKRVAGPGTHPTVRSLTFPSSILPRQADLQATIASPDGPGRDIALPELSLTLSHADKEETGATSHEWNQYKALDTPILEEAIIEPEEPALKGHIHHTVVTGEVLHTHRRSALIERETLPQNFIEDGEEINIVLVDSRFSADDGIPSGENLMVTNTHARQPSSLSPTNNHADPFGNQLMRSESITAESRQAKMASDLHNASLTFGRTSIARSDTAASPPSAHLRTPFSSQSPVPSLTAKVFLPKNVRLYLSLPLATRTSHSPLIGRFQVLAGVDDTMPVFSTSGLDADIPVYPGPQVRSKRQAKAPSARHPRRRCKTKSTDSRKLDGLSAIYPSDTARVDAIIGKLLERVEPVKDTAKLQSDGPPQSDAFEHQSGAQMPRTLPAVALDSKEDKAELMKHLDAERAQESQGVALHDHAQVNLQLLADVVYMAREENRQVSPPRASVDSMSSLNADGDGDQIEGTDPRKGNVAACSFGVAHSRSTRSRTTRSATLCEQDRIGAEGAFENVSMSYATLGSQAHLEVPQTQNSHCNKLCGKSPRESSFESPRHQSESTVGSITDISPEDSRPAQLKRYRTATASASADVDKKPQAFLGDVSGPATKAAEFVRRKAAIKAEERLQQLPPKFAAIPELSTFGNGKRRSLKALSTTSSVTEASSDSAAKPITGRQKRSSVLADPSRTKRFKTTDMLASDACQPFPVRRYSAKEELLDNVQQALLNAGFSGRSSGGLKYRIRERFGSLPKFKVPVDAEGEADTDVDAAEVDTSVLEEAQIEEDDEDDPLLLK